MIQAWPRACTVFGGNHVFYKFSIIAPMANVIVLPFISFAILAGFLAAVVGTLSLPVAARISQSLNWFLTHDFPHH